MIVPPKSPLTSGYVGLDIVGFVRLSAKIRDLESHYIYLEFNDPGKTINHTIIVLTIRLDLIIALSLSTLEIVDHVAL